MTAVEARLGEYRQQVRGLEQAKADQVLVSQGQIARINEAAHRLIVEGDVMVRSSDGSLCPANKAVLIASSRYFTPQPPSPQSIYHIHGVRPYVPLKLRHHAVQPR